MNDSIEKVMDISDIKKTMRWAANKIRDEWGDYSPCALELDRAITALSANECPAGWKLVPIEPNWDMRNEGREFLIDGTEKEPEKLAYFLWKTMIGVSPEPPALKSGVR
jgi:hypothetical protein